MKKVIILATAFVCMAAGTVSAQFNETNNLFYHSFRNPNAVDYNAAFFPLNNTFYLRLPGAEAQFGSPLSINQIMHYDKAAGKTIIDINNIFDALSEDNKLRMDINAELVGFGFKIRNTFINFNLDLRNNFSFGLPISTINALTDGNVGEDGKAISEITLLDGDLMNFTSYLQAGIGAGHYFPSINLTAGVRAKLLYGVLNVQTDNTLVTLNTDSHYDKVTANVYYQLQEAGAVQLDTSEGRYRIEDVAVSDLLKLGEANMGFSFDLGFKYDLGPFSFSLAINDLSAGIHWRKNLNTIQPKNGHGVFEFEGVEVQNVLDQGEMNTDTIKVTLEDFLDDVKPEFTRNGDDYWYSIPTKINLGASFSFAKILRAGVLLHGQFDRGLLSKKNALALDLGDGVKNTFRFNATGSLGVNVFNWAEVIVGSSVVYDGDKFDFFNPGFGLTLTPATVLQIYMMMDYVSSIYLAEAKAFNLKVGVNLLIGKGGRSKIIAG